ISCGFSAIRTKTVIPSLGSSFHATSPMQTIAGPDIMRLYVKASCPCTYDQVYEIDVPSGRARFLAWGDEIGVLRNGPWLADGNFRPSPGLSSPPIAPYRASRTLCGSEFIIAPLCVKIDVPQRHE